MLCHADIYIYKYVPYDTLFPVFRKFSMTDTHDITDNSESFSTNFNNSHRKPLNVANTPLFHVTDSNPSPVVHLRYYKTQLNGHFSHIHPIIEGLRSKGR